MTSSQHEKDKMARCYRKGQLRGALHELKEIRDLMGMGESSTWVLEIVNARIKTLETDND